MEIRLDGLLHWFHYTAFPKYTYPKQYHAMIDQQEQPDRNQLLLSRFGILWYDLQNSHPCHSPMTDGKHSGMSWILSMILTIWSEVQLQWEVRNNTKHGNT